MLRSELDNVAQSADVFQNSLKKDVVETFFTRRKSLFIFASAEAKAIAAAFVTLKNDLKHSMQYGIMENCLGHFAKESFYNVFMQSKYTIFLYI